MNNVVFINALNLSPYAFKELPSGISAFKAAGNTASNLPDVGKVFVLNDSSLSAGENFEIISDTIKSMKDLFEVLSRYSENFENIYYFFGDAPLVDSDITRRMYLNHQKYFASYTFADGYPHGLSLEILKNSILPRLIDLANKHPLPVSRGGIFEIIQKDINSFDIETEISDKDQRMLRVSLTADTRRNFNQLCRIMNAGGKDERSIVGILETQEELLRTEPAYVNVQITGGCPQTCSYCPYPGIESDVLTNKKIMKLDNWKIILQKVHEYCDDAVFSISLWGEPSLHPDIVELVKETLLFPSFSLIIETSGIGWSREKLDAIKSVSEGRVTWILSLDAENETSYRNLRGNGWDAALSAVEYLFANFKDNFYIQAVRMKSNEDFLEKFYRTWKEKGVKTIIQKYDHFSNTLSDERVTDISPVKRFPCWHLKRDLTILIDGTVQQCREDLHNDFPLGNIFTEELPEIWERGTPLYTKHIHGEYPGICGTCDEYYTYNF